MAELFFPYTIEVSKVESIVPPKYNVDIVASVAKIETRTLMSSDPSEGTISITISNETDESLGALWDFYQLCNGTHRSFEIKEDHNLYDLFPYFARRRFLPLWRFAADLSYGLENSNLCLYGISIELKNVAV